MTGRITEVIRARACGFIRAAGGERVFFHASEVQGITFDKLQEHLAVRFTLVPDAISGPRAAGVHLDSRVKNP